MFYLITFYKVLLQTPARSFFFCLLGVGLVVGISHKENLENFFSRDSVVENRGNYFYALVSGKKNYSSISRRIRDLPGVERVDILSEKFVRESAGEIFEQANLDMAFSWDDFRYGALKVIFSEALQRRSQELIREYLGRLVGKSDIALGSIKRVEKNDEGKKGGGYFLRYWGAILILSLGVLIWVVLAQSYVRQISKKAYLIENFQRRKKVVFKMVFVGISSIFFSGILLSMLWASPQLKWMLVSLAPFLLSTLFYLKGREWQS